MRSALLVVDMLNDFVDGVLGNPLAKDVVGPIARLAEQARRTPAWVVVYANDAHRPDDVELTVFPPHAMAGTAGAMVIGELEPHPDDVVVGKRFYSAFTESSLEERLAAHEVGRLVLVGQHTDCCVRHTGYDAFARGFELVICPDATTVFGPGSEEEASARQARALDYLATYYGAHLLSTDAVS
jgi:nicotinamidase-related amidase